MQAPRDFEELKQRLITMEPVLPKRLRQTATFALNHPDAIALGTAAHIAREAQVQASTLVRLAQAVGFAGFTELQSVFRSRLVDRRVEYSERLKALQGRAADPDDPTGVLFGFCDAASRSLHALRAQTEPAALEDAVARLARARTIFLIAQRRAFSVAHYLAYGFAQLGVEARLVDDVGGLGPEQIAGASACDAVLAVSFSPYSPKTLALVEAARARGAEVVAITDGALSPLAQLADRALEAPESDFAAFRSLAATFSLAGAIAVSVAERRTRAAPRARDLSPAAPD